MAAADLPADLAGLVAEIERLTREFNALAEPLDETAFNWRPESGRAWSVGQCVDHLARINRVYLGQLEEAERHARERGLARRAPLAPNRLGRWFLGLMEPPARPRFSAAKQALPAATCPKAATLESFAAEQRRAIALTRALAGVDANRVRFKNPLMANLPSFNLAAGVLILLAHERRHLAQARRVRADPGFPPV